MSASKSPEPGPLAKAASAEIRAEMARQRMTGRDLAAKTDRSQNYTAKRLRDEYAFTLDEVDAIAKALGTTYEILMRAATERMRSS